jgi:hypothetical protein
VTKFGLIRFALELAYDLATDAVRALRAAPTKPEAPWRDQPLTHADSERQAEASRWAGHENERPPRRVR